LLWAWGIGGSEWCLPAQAGMAVGELQGRNLSGVGNFQIYFAFIIHFLFHFFLVLQIHYNNPGGLTGIYDNSGVKLKYTTQLRPNDAGFIWFGAGLNKINIPPRTYNRL